MVLLLAAVTLLLLLCLVIALVLTVRRVQVGAPDEVLVVSGRQDTRVPGIQRFTLTRGRVLPVPLLEVVDRLSLAPVPLSLRVQSPREGHDVSVKISARVCVEDEAEMTARAARLLLGLSTERVALMANRIIHGATLEVLPSLSADEVAADPLHVGQRVVERAAKPLARLGLVCEHLTVEP